MSIHPKKIKFETVPPPPPPTDLDENLHILVYMVRKENLPNISVFGKVLFEIWALKVLLKQQNWPTRSIKNLLPYLKFEK